MADIVVRSATVVTINERREVLTGDVAINGSTIAAVGTVAARGRREIDGEGCVLLPGLVQAHIHLCQTLFRNVADGMPLLEWLRSWILPLEALHDERSMRASVRLGVAELLRGGTTCVLDMGSVHHTEVVFSELEALGLRASSGKAMMDCGDEIPRALCEEPSAALEESVALLRRWHGAAQGRLRYAFAPRFALSSSAELHRQVAEEARRRNARVHSHAAEHRDEVARVRGRTGKGNVAYLHGLGLTGPQLCLAHCVWLGDEEMAILRETGTHVLHCPTANLKLGSGIAKVPEMRAMGINVALGSDGAACNNNLDAFQEMRMAALIQGARLGAGALPAQAVVEMATLGGARTLGLADQIGSIEVGKKADLILVDVHRPHNSPGHDIYGQLVFACRSSDVRTVIIDGNIVVHQGRVLVVDEEEVVRRAEEESSRLLRKMR
ncbi:MAG: 5'-deoxyadenosine deaminase [bacterium]|jgi:cytosine/adenosine deaminase-related metal-dependent hydrolase|nr:5'-deoxyadenosine deaminase [candidate division KSB1 bacterium]MDH7561605.1 5'-deoxyadenosine deaminase [bacterium]